MSGHRQEVRSRVCPPLSSPRCSIRGWGKLSSRQRHAAEQAEPSVHDAILEMLEQDPGLDSGVKDAVLDALAEVVGQTQDNAEARTAPTFLTTISVAGFRGIGRQARLDLYPAPGLMVVSGRNGSGKSSFAEALELALTGTSYRWHKKEVLWTETWRNLHRSDPVPSASASPPRAPVRSLSAWTGRPGPR